MPCWVSPPRPSSQRSLLAGTPASRRSRGPRPTNAALSASETTLQSALDAILAELAALQLSGSGGVVNAPGRASRVGSSFAEATSFATCAALANGDDTLSITADCYSTADTDAAITAALLAYYTSAQVDALLGDHRGSAGRGDDQCHHRRTAGLLHLGAGRRTVGRLPHGKRADQDVFTTNQITSALVAYRSAADQDTATASSIAAALLSYYTIAQVDGLLAGKLGVTEAASALQIAVRFPTEGPTRWWPP